MKSFSIFLLVIGIGGLLLLFPNLKYHEVKAEVININTKEVTFRYSGNKILTKEISQLESQIIKVGDKLTITVEDKSNSTIYVFLLIFFWCFIVGFIMALFIFLDV